MSKINRRQFIGTSAAGLMSASQAAAQTAKAKKNDHPNILLIITDQQHSHMMSCAGNPYVKTPAMDRLAARGVRFDRAYCGNPVCMPSRFSMMTGVLPGRIGMEKNGRADVPAELLSHAMGNVFRANGYQTVYGGKVHLPGDRKKGIAAYGFDYLIDDEREDLAQACGTFFRQEHEKPFLLVASFINPHDICYMAIDAYTKAQSKPLKFPNSEEERARLQEALQIPAGLSKEEFFDSVCPPLPENFAIPKHEPPAARESDWRAFRQYVQNNWSEEAWRLHRWAYAKLTERVDAHIGNVLDSLQETGLDKETVVVFVSDHGDMDAAHKLEHKSMPYDEAARVPFIVSQPGVTREGHVDRENLVSTGLDLIPTLCDYAGIGSPPQLAGKSVKSLTTSSSQTQPWRDTVVVENELSRILIHENYKYTIYDRGNPREMLIDLKHDPGEMNNLAVDPNYQEILARHRDLLKKWYQENNETLNKKYIVG
ncbi:sulfatase-like hydrolase/transferase [bacterium]|nr:sulfatase-like hydrolase/transferase [bacterium]